MRMPHAIKLNFQTVLLATILISMGLALFCTEEAYALSPETRAPFVFHCTDSMAPTITCRDNIYGSYLGRNDQESLKVGDVIEYDPRVSDNLNSWVTASLRLRGLNMVVHRIVKIEEGCYITRGDNNGFDDDICVKPAMVKFLITRVERRDAA